MYPFQSYWWRSGVTALHKTDYTLRQVNSNEDICQRQGFGARGDRVSDARVVRVKRENAHRSEEEPGGVKGSTSAELTQHRKRIPEGMAKQASLALIAV